MKRLLVAIVVLGGTLAGSAALSAQTPTGTSYPATPAQTHSSAVNSTTQQKVATAALASQDATSAALQAVVQFLQLRPDQQTVLGQLLQARQQTLTPILQAIAQREGQLYQLFESGGTPADIGQLAIQIHTLQKQIAQVQQDFLGRWESLLTPDQQERLQNARVAASLQPISPAFQLLHLL